MQTIKYALKKTFPIFCGYLFLGFAFGILLADAGYSWVWALACSALIYAGSMQFVLVSFLASGAPLTTVLIMTLLINGRHIFYGLSFIDRYRKVGKFYPYLVFSLTDETYSVLCSAQHPENVDPRRADFFISLFDHFYWILGSLLGCVAGQLVPIDFTGIDFTMTALFIVIFIEQWKTYKPHVPAVTGGACALLSLMLFGPDNFLLPALGAAVAILLGARRYIAARMPKEGDAA